MEALNVLLNQASEFDHAVHGCKTHPALAQASQVDIITKDAATQGGRAGAVITFLVSVDGKPMRAQATVTVRNLVAALQIIEARYEDGMPRVGN